MFGEHDHDRIDAREMLGASKPGTTATSRRGRSRSHGRNWRKSDGANASAPGSSRRRTAVRPLRRHRPATAMTANGWSPAPRAPRSGERRHRSQGTARHRRLVAIQAPAVVELRNSVPPDQLARVLTLVSAAILPDRPQGVGAVEAGALKEGFRRQAGVTAGSKAGRPCGRASEGPPPRGRRAAATNPRLPARARGTTDRSSEK